MKLSEEIRNFNELPADVPLAEWADAVEKLEQQLESARNDIRYYVMQLDNMYGTPCEQIRHKQEVERLEQQLADCKDDLANARTNVEIQKLAADTAEKLLMRVNTTGVSIQGGQAAIPMALLREIQDALNYTCEQPHFMDCTCDRDNEIRDFDRLSAAAIDFIDQMRVQGLEGRLLPAEYDTLVDVVKDYRVDIDET